MRALSHMRASLVLKAIICVHSAQHSLCCWRKMISNIVHPFYITWPAHSGLHTREKHHSLWLGCTQHKMKYKVFTQDSRKHHMRNSIWCCTKTEPVSALLLEELGSNSSIELVYRITHSKQKIPGYPQECIVKHQSGTRLLKRHQQVVRSVLQANLSKPLLNP